jgi:hypothetical protein
LLKKLTARRLVEDEPMLDGAKAAAEPIRVRAVMSFMVVGLDVILKYLR